MEQIIYPRFIERDFEQRWAKFIASTVSNRPSSPGAGAGRGVRRTVGAAPGAAAGVGEAGKRDMQMSLDSKRTTLGPESFAITQGRRLRPLVPIKPTPGRRRT
jgi:hypothetical protein